MSYTMTLTDEVKLRENSDWYYANLSSLLPKYQGRYVAVADKALFGDYGECVEGVRALESAGFPRGTFIVHKCVPLEQERREWYFRTNRFKTRTCPA